jgi:hypothetical protein
MRRLLPLLVALLLVPSARSQALAAYVTLSPSHLSNIQTGAVYSVSGGYINQTTSYTTVGVGGGITANFLPIGPIRLGFDLRGSTRPGTSGVDSALIGVKLGVHPPGLRLHPYIQASVGYLASRTTNVSTPPGQTSGQAGGTFGNQYAVYEILGGIDYPLVGPLDFRVVEIGGGSGIANFGSYNPAFFTVNTGLVVHF